MGDKDTDYKELYYKLFNDLYDIIRSAKCSRDFEAVFLSLMNALTDAEDRFINQPEQRKL